MGNTPSQPHHPHHHHQHHQQAPSGSSTSTSTVRAYHPSQHPSSSSTNGHSNSSNTPTSLSALHLLQSTPSPLLPTGNTTNASSSIRSLHQLSTSSIDSGYLLPISNVYPSSAQDWNHSIVQRLVLSRKLAPFYRGLEDWNEQMTVDEISKSLLSLTQSRQQQVQQILSTEISSLVQSTTTISSSSQPDPTSQTPSASLSKRIGKTLIDRTSSSATMPAATSSSSSKSPTLLSSRYQVFEAVRICQVRPTESGRFYPPNINYSRCCQQPICTECFVQIKRSDPTPQELKSEPACCPYCVESNFGVTYVPPPPDLRIGWSLHPGSEALSSPSSTRAPGLDIQAGALSPITKSSEEAVSEDQRKMKRRQTTSHTSQEVVTTDSIQEDWQIKLEAVKAAVQRRANRRIIFRQDGDRLIPVGITSSRDPNNQEENRRSRRVDQVAQQYGIELEEMMVMEAMRLSLMEEEERKKKAVEEEKKIKDQISDAVVDHPQIASGSHQDPAGEVEGQLKRIEESRGIEDGKRRRIDP